jgi:uncharacterized protein YcfJ
MIKKIFLSTIILLSSAFAGSDRFYDYSKVTYSQPIYEYVYDNEPRRECKEVRQRVKNYDDGYYSSNYDDNLGVDTLIGVAAGAVLGSQVGKGNGRVAAQIVGGLLGGKIAHEIRNNYKPSQRNSYNDNYSYETVTNCYDKQRRTKRKMITGYKNYFVYKGVEHFKITNRPERKIKITHSINF